MKGKILITVWVAMLCMAGIANIRNSMGTNNSVYTDTTHPDFYFTPNTVIMSVGENVGVDVSIPLGYGDLGIYYENESDAEYVDFDYTDKGVSIFAKKKTQQTIYLEGYVYPISLSRNANATFTSGISVIIL